MIIVVGAVIGALIAFVPRRRVPIALNVFVAVCSAFLAAELAATYRAPDRPVVLTAPFAGDWFVAQGGHSELVNGHRADPAQREALDMVQVADGSTHNPGGTGLADYYAFDAPVLAPADGVVVYLSDTLADRRPSSPDPDPANAAGNQLVIDIGGGRYVHVAHLEQNSSLVNVGDRVQRGQAIARVGNSGDSAEPHLQIQVQDSPRPDISRAGVHTFPILFRDITLTRGGSATHPATVDLRRGDRLHADTW
jgi:murein DD-endopeptidase MepM/ murein hydrolase activator NlpD